MSEDLDKVIERRYDRTSSIRDRAIDLLAVDDQRLSQTIADKDSASILIKMLDGQDKQTIARQKNRTDEKAVGAVTSIQHVAKEVIQAMGGPIGIRGEPDASAAPRESIPIKVTVNEGELEQGADEALTAEALLGSANG